MENIEESFNYKNDIENSINTLVKNLTTIKDSLNGLNVQDDRELKCIESLLLKSIKKFNKEQKNRINKNTEIQINAVQTKYPIIQD